MARREAGRGTCFKSPLLSFNAVLKVYKSVTLIDLVFNDKTRIKNIRSPSAFGLFLLLAFSIYEIKICSRMYHHNDYDYFNDYPQNIHTIVYINIDKIIS